MKKIIMFASILPLAGCMAKAPADIAATPASTDRYAQMQCSELVPLRAQTTADFNVLEKQQLSAARTDATAVATIHVPVGSWMGKDKEQDYARAKGEKQAIDSVYQSKGCTG